MGAGLKYDRALKLSKFGKFFHPQYFCSKKRLVTTFLRGTLFTAFYRGRWRVLRWVIFHRHFNYISWKFGFCFTTWVFIILYCVDMRSFVYLTKLKDKVLLSYFGKFSFLIWKTFLIRQKVLTDGLNRDFNTPKFKQNQFFESFENIRKVSDVRIKIFENTGKSPRLADLTFEQQNFIRTKGIRI